MDTLPLDLLTLLDIKLDPYEAILLDLIDTDIDTKWFWYNYSKRTLGYEIIKLCKKGDEESLELIMDLITEERFGPPPEVLFQILMVALKKDDDILFGIASIYEFEEEDDNLSSIVYIESVRYNKHLSLDNRIKITGELIYMGYVVQWAINALSQNDIDGFKRALGYYLTDDDTDEIKALMLKPNTDFDVKIMDGNKYCFLAIFAAITDNLELLKVIFINFSNMNDERILKCAMLRNSHKIIEYLVNLYGVNNAVINTAHRLGYYYRPFWENIASLYPFAIHGLDFFKPLRYDAAIGNSIYRIELNDIKMLFSLSAPSKRELNRLASIANRYCRYDIYCYCWELLASN